MARGVIYVAYGRKAKAEAAKSIESLHQYHDWPVRVVGEDDWPDCGAPGRWAKVNLNKLTSWEQTLFLDADTRVRGRLDFGFRLLDVGYEMVLVPSRPQHNDALRHLDDKERDTTLREVGIDPLQLNTGVMWFSEAADPLFTVWREEWERWRDKDQGALLRALKRHPLGVAVLGWPFNDEHGEVVEHRFGACGG